MNLTQHFTLEEFCLSTTAVSLGIPNIPSPALYHAMRATCGGLERIRTITQKPIVILSGFRTEQLNQMLMGAKNSQHLEGEAADIICPGYGTPLEFAKVIEEHALSINYDQMILEYAQWVHISFSVTPRREALTRRTRLEGYLKGIVV